MFSYEQINDDNDDDCLIVWKWNDDIDVCIMSQRIQAELTSANAKGVFPSAQVPVTVTVLGVNDNKPAFSQSTYTATLSDCDVPGDLLSMNSLITITDLDQVLHP